MPIGNFTKANIEAQASEILKNSLALFEAAEQLRSRCDAELAAGTFDSSDFYPVDDPKAQTDKANLLGALDDWHAVYQGIQGGVLPQANYLRYVSFLIGV